MKRTALAATLLIAVVAAGCGRSEPTTTPTSAPVDGATSSTVASKCTSEPLKATETGVTASTITISVMADVNSPLAPGLFRGNWEGIDSWAKDVNAKGGLGCRKVVVNHLDSALDPSKATNGNIQACKDSLAMVGNNALFNPTAGSLAKCKDSAGAATGLPDVAGLANDFNELCNTTTYLIQSSGETCPLQSGARPIELGQRTWKYFQELVPDLHGMFVAPGDLPTTLQASVPLIEAAKQAGVKWDYTTPASALLPQPGYDKFIQQLKASKSNFVYMGSNDASMVKFRKEARAQGFNDVKLWGCSLACYTRSLLSSGGTDVEGTTMFIPFLPFEEADLNPDAKAFLDGVGGIEKSTSWGAQAFQAGRALERVVNELVEAKGPNAITRAAILDGLSKITDFDSNGWIGKKALRGSSPCVVFMKVKDGKFVRAYPEKRGTFDCTDKGVVVNVDTVEGAKAVR